MATAKPKILIVGPGFPYRNGPAIYLSYLCNQLKADFDIELVNYTMLYPSFLFPGKTQYDDSEQVFSYPNVRMVNSLNPLSWIKTARHINKQNPDLVVFDWWHPFFAPCHAGIVSFLKKRLKKKVMYITENVISHEANKTDKVLTKLALKNAQCFLALSDAVRNHLSGMFDKKIFQSELPIYSFYNQSDVKDEQHYKAALGFDKDDIVFLFFGLVRKYKGLDLLIEAFGNLSKTRNNIKLLIVGEFYEDVKPYLDLIEQYDIKDKVRVENRYVLNEEVGNYFLACDVNVLPYRSATQSGVLNVAYSFYKPAIVTNVGELANLVEQDKTGIVVNEASAQNIQEGMEHFITLKDKGTAFNAFIKKYIEEKHSFRKVNGVFNEILNYLK